MPEPAPSGTSCDRPAEHLGVRVDVDDARGRAAAPVEEGAPAIGGGVRTGREVAQRADREGEAQGERADDDEGAPASARPRVILGIGCRPARGGGHPDSAPSHVRGLSGDDSDITSLFRFSVYR